MNILPRCAAALVAFWLPYVASIAAETSSPGANAYPAEISLGTLAQQVSQDFDARNFLEIERLVDEWARSQGKVENGRWKLEALRKGLIDEFTAGRMWDQYSSRITAWRKLSPQSAAAAIAETVYWQAYAWDARGESLGAYVSPTRLTICSRGGAVRMSLSMDS